MHKPILKVMDLCKSYCNNTLFNNFNMEFERGCFVITGPNGVGKSTLLSLLSGAILADSGEIQINGIDVAKFPAAAKKLISYVPDKVSLFPFLTGKEFIELVCALRNEKPLDNVRTYISMFEVHEYLDVQFADMSLGNQKKFFIIAAFIFNPLLLIMDEPSNGLDMASKQRLVNIINDLKKSSIVLLSSHDMEFNSKIADKSIELQKRMMVCP